MLKNIKKVALPHKQTAQFSALCIRAALAAPALAPAVMVAAPGALQLRLESQDCGGLFQCMNQCMKLNICRR